MGFFSFMTQDTNESIPNCHSGRDMGTIYIHDDKGNVEEYDNYDGYGEFNGLSFFFMIDAMNRKRPINPCDDIAWEKAIERGHRLYYKPRKDTRFPNITRSKDWTWRNEKPAECPDQGFFYDDEESNKAA